MQREAIDKSTQAIAEKMRGVASSIVDPETGKHADVFVRRTGDTTMVLKTSGSPAFAAELERRLGLDAGAVRSGQGQMPGSARSSIWRTDQRTRKRLYDLSHIA